MFADLDWRRLDVFSILVGRGVASVHHAHRIDAQQWLEANGYQVIELDFASGISPVVENLGQMLSWRNNFGYDLAGNSRNLAALRDGFDFRAPESGGLALDVLAFDRAFTEDPKWSHGFLSIISEHSIRELACGRRFFGLFNVEHDESPLIGQVFEELSVPYPYPFRAPVT